MHIFFRTRNDGLLEVVAKIWPFVNNWTEVRQGVKLAEIWSQNGSLFRFLYLDKNATFGQHSYDESTELLHILSADEDTAQMGQCEQWMNAIKTDSSHYFCKTAPKMIKVRILIGRKNSRIPLNILCMHNLKCCI